MPGLSAAFTVEGNPNPDEHVVAYGATVDLAISSFAYNSISWEIVGTSYSGQSNPTITLGGSPVGSTASFPMPSDPGDGLGRSFRVKCTVTNSIGETATQYAIVGALNVSSLLPVPVGEELGDRHATHGWTDVINAALAGVAGSGGVGAILTPSQITGNTDNYNPTGLATARALRLSTDASRNLTGIAAAGGAAPFDRKMVINVGSFDLVLKHDTTSTTTNRFVCPGALDVTLRANDSTDIFYDSTTQRWRIV